MLLVLYIGYNLFIYNKGEKKCLAASISSKQYQEQAYVLELYTRRPWWQKTSIIFAFAFFSAENRRPT